MQYETTCLHKNVTIREYFGNKLILLEIKINHYYPIKRNI